MSDQLLQRLSTRQLIQVPGPNPILIPGTGDEWDSSIIECCNVIKDQDTYYLYYHGVPLSEREQYTYRIGVATASNPLGPWEKYNGNPVVDLGSEGSWDGGERNFVAGATILKEKGDTFYLWYNSTSHKSEPDIGLAYADNPLGPWKKYEGNPVIKDFGYLGGIVKVKGKYFMYTEHFVGESSPDQGPMALATADRPEGPWIPYDRNPVLKPDDWGSWEDGGYSEAGVIHHDGVFHMFYGGTKWNKLESIGYACSVNGYDWVKHVDNPVAPRENNPDASGFAEVHTLWENPFYYLFHTLRYNSRKGFEEDLGVQVLVTRTPFKLTIPALAINTLAPGAASSLDNELKGEKTVAISGCPPISLESAATAVVTAECTYADSAKTGARLHVRASADGLEYDTHDMHAFDLPLDVGRLVRRTVKIDSGARFVKIQIENMDGKTAIQNVKASVTVGSL